MDTLVRDARYAARILRRSPASSVAAVLTLALAIGINTAVFSIVDAVLLRPLPYPSPERLALAARIVRSGGIESRDSSVDGRTWEAVRDHATSAERAVFSSWTTGVNLVVPGAGGRYVQQQRVGAGFFRTLGVPPRVGREFAPDEDRPGGPSAVILSGPLWRDLFASDPSIVGKPIMLRGTPYNVVGVMPDGFQSGERADVWTPLRPGTTGEGGENYQVLLRLRADAWAQLDRELAVVSGVVRTTRPSESGNDISISFLPLQEGMSAPLLAPLLTLWAAVGVVLLVACTNLAGLLLARGSGRAREIATRMALGSGRGTVLRQLLIESVVLALVGGTAGIVVGLLTIDGLTWLARDAYEIWQPVGLDLRSIAIAGMLSLAASAMFGLGPALQAARTDIRAGLMPAGARAIAGHSRRWTRRTIVVLQVAGMVLLVSAGLLLRTFAHLNTLDPGFDARNVIAAAVSLEDERYRTHERVSRLFGDVIERLTRTSGIDAAAVALEVPYKRLLNLGFRHLDGSQARSGGAAATGITSATYVSAGFFQAMRIPVRRGRAFTAADRTDAPPVVIVSDVRTYFNGEDPIGRRIAVAGGEREIVGQVGDIQVRPGWGNHGPLSAMPVAYIPVGQVSDGFLRLVHGWFAPRFIVRANTSDADAAAAIRRAIEGADPLLPLAHIRLMTEVQSVSLAPQRFLMALLLALAGAALLLAGIGIHGLIASSVTERTREMGIRLALGASSAHAIRTIALPGIVLAAIGVGVGATASSLAVRALRSFVWGVSASDPLTFVAVGSLLFLVASIASILPTLRILRLDPAATLRME